ncbi:MAG: M23 family peptidase, partial [Christiangramia sp.]
MKNHLLKFIGVVLAFLSFSCGKLTKVTDVITQPTAREVYARNFDADSLPYRLWTNAFQNALKDSLQITSPYQEIGIFNSEIHPVYGYDLDLERGRSYTFSIQTDTLQPKVFIDLYEKTSDSIRPYKLVQQADDKATALDFSPKNSGTYKVLFQPELNSASSFAIRIQSKPSYYFPVSGASAKSIQSFWGAARD